MLTLLNILRWKVQLSLWSVILLLIAIGGISLYVNTRQASSLTKSVVPSLTLVPTTSYTFQKDGLITTHEVVQGKTYTEKDFQVLADSLKKSNSHLTGKIQTITKVVTIFQHDSIPVEYTLDTSNHNFELIYDDSDIHIDCHGSTVQKDGVLHFFVRSDTASYVTTVKKHLFHSDVYSTDVSHTNKLFFTSAGETLVLMPPKPLICFGPIGGAFYSIKTGRIEPVIGIGLCVNLFSLKQKD